MQSAPSEALQTATSVETLPGTGHPLHHGLSPPVEPVPDQLSSVEAVRAPSIPGDDTDNASTTSSYTHRGRRLDGRRLSQNGSSSNESSPGSRIDEYERAHTFQRKPVDGMIFQIIPTAAGKQPTTTLLDLPNEVLTHVISNLPPETLSMMSLVSSRFHKLVTTPHAWRIAFTRYFPGADPLIATAQKGADAPVAEALKTERRYFTRLSALASWRSEYILRTRLLRSLARGRPAIQATPKSTSRHGNASAAAVVTYGSSLVYPVSHLHATFGVGLNKKQPLFMHGAVEQGIVSTSDPSTTKLGSWGLGDFENFKHFEDLFIGEVEYGLGLGEVVGMPNVMDISQPYGKIYGEACPGGRVFFTSTSEQRGRFLTIASSAQRKLGIPEVSMIGCAVTSVWIAKSENVLKATNGIFGCLAGFSNGVLAAYALGVNPVHDRRFAHGELTAKWVVSPGVPIIAISVDEQLNTRRSEHGKIWAVVLNALGEVFYLTDSLSRPDFKGRASIADIDRLAWQTGRSVNWHLIENTRRKAMADPFNLSTVDRTYSPRSSSDALKLSGTQLSEETKEIERFLIFKPKHFRNICDGWDMRRKLLVDFSGGEGADGGESIFVVSCGLEEDSTTSVMRFMRCKTKLADYHASHEYSSIDSRLQSIPIPGHQSQTPVNVGAPLSHSVPLSRTSSHEDIDESIFRVQWFATNFTLGHLRGVQISAVAADESEFATVATNEDPLLGMSGGSHGSSPTTSPSGAGINPDMTAEIPGHRARFLAIGTMTGMVVLWNMRASISQVPELINEVQPFRYIYTRSPQVSSLALTSLYVVHGGNDGLVQAWDPLGSSTEPIRTLNSRFSDRARRRIAQAEASIHGVGRNYYAAGAIVLDPDPTVLRGMVSLGTFVRYWSYSAGAADAYKSRKRGQLRHRSERGSATAINEPKFHQTGRSVLKDYIQNEKQDLDFEKVAKQKEKERFSGRYGTDLLGDGATEEELLAYAALLSKEAFAEDEARLKSSTATIVGSSGTPFEQSLVDTTDHDIEEAIRLSLLGSEVAAESPQTFEMDIPIRYAKGQKRGTPLRRTAGSSAWDTVSPSADSDLDFVLQLSLAEEQSRMLNEDDFPVLSTSPDSDGSAKGKGKSKRR